jgi:O-acetylserine/cysteine efflux transporter
MSRCSVPSERSGFGYTLTARPRSPILLAISFVRGEAQDAPARTDTWTAFVYVVTLGTVGVFLLFLFVLRRWQASSVAYEFVLAPIVATALGALLLDEALSALAAIGAVLVLAGVYVGALAPTKRPETTSTGRDVA